MISDILVPVDGSENSYAAVDWAGVLAARFNARVTLLHAMTEWGSWAVPDELAALAQAENIKDGAYQLRQALAEKIIANATDRLRAHGAADPKVVIGSGNPAAVILDQSKALKPDLIVMGRRGLGILPGLLLGSVSSKVLHLADCACLTVK